jgi:hypothetical protein
LRISRWNRIPPPMRQHTGHCASPRRHSTRAGPRAVIYVHLSEAALRAGSGVARVEDVRPVLLNRLHMLARPGSGASDPISVTTTGSRPSAAGRSDNPNPAAGYGDHPTAAST